MTTRTTDFPSALKATLFDAWDVAFKGKDAQYKKVFHVEESQDNYEDMLQVQGPDTIPVSGEGQVYERVEIENVRSKRFTWVIYKGEIKITREMLDDCKYRMIVDGAKHIGQAVARTIDTVAAAFFYNGLTGAEITPDGVGVFSTAHVLSNPLAGRSGTATNKGTGTLSVANVRSGRTLGRKTPDEHGSVAPRNFSQLILPADLEDEGDVIQQSTLRPGSTAPLNDKNVTGPKIKDIVVLDYLADAPANGSTSWFLRDPEESKNYLFWRVKPEREIVRDQGSNDYLFRSYMRFGLGAADWRGLFGSDGTGSATVL